MYAYTPALLPSLITTIFLLAVSIYSWRRLRVPGALPFAIGSLFGALWVVTIILQQAALDLETQLFWFKAQTAWILFGITPMVCFSLEYTWPGRWLTRRNIALLSVVPILTLVVVLTNDLHHWMWTGFTFNGTIVPQFGSLRPFFITYGFFLSIIEMVVFAWLFIRSPQHRWPAAFMLFGKIVSRALYFLGINIPFLLFFPTDVLAVAFPFLMYAIALFGFRILDPIALARQTAIEQIHSGMLVLDARGRIAGLNPAAESILGLTARQAKGQSIQDHLPVYPEGSPDKTGGEIESILGGRHYALAVSPLKDWRGVEVGHLALLRDVTEQKQAQEQIIEQQRTLAMLKEREHLSRELHDSIGQVLAYAGLQVDAAAKLARDGKVDAAAAQLDRLGSVVRDAHADVREYILNLRIAPSQQLPFFQMLRQYLDGYTINYDIQTHLILDPEIEDENLSPEAQLQVLRILQEALSNARKHGRARHVRVIFAAKGEQVSMTVQDDGEGFTPIHGNSPGGQHFGMRFMQERAAQLGGDVQIHSTPGIGTQVVLTAPRKER